MANIEDRRAFLRLDMEKELITVSWFDTNERQFIRDVMCIDVSKGGFKISIEREIAVNTEVKVQFKSHLKQSKIYVAKVLRAIKQDHGWYDIGLEFIK
ncbi:PilZ domain-containing protein [Pseudoalteromonas denitrificans]|uniref:PilZ domain-containing protein n=1 Tax=Pseudoalteromonas denitrificans DSM 6059 TaxID=1123010 RepID=A0A1I1FLM3_9GAMM|nr:PilZ domain-containing protein [Pseudoalteromonas denitrificans]SFB97940.1 PilZ domain-containing protein [Pseudoalteromonas denitrificans DSM 6059]